MPTKFNEGDRIVTCGTSPGFHANGNYYAPKVYEARIRKKDKALVWKLSYVAKHHEVGVAGWLPTLAVLRVARAYARDQDLPFLADVKDNMEVELSIRRNRVTRPKAKTVQRKVTKDGIETIVEELLPVGRFKKIDDDDLL